MPGKWPPDELPGLNDSTCRITSPDTPIYNCIAWAAKNNSRWWWPDPLGIGYWPLAERTATVDCFVKLFESLGYSICLNASREEGIEKVAIFGHKAPDRQATPTHAALQLSNGEWTSKLGPFEDVVHPDLYAVDGPVYGRPLVFMSRPRSARTNR